MKNIPYIIYLIFTMFAFSYFGYSAASIIFSVIGLVITPIIVWKIHDVNDLKRRGKMFENIYVISCHPELGVAPVVPIQIAKLCIFVKYEDVANTVAFEKKRMQLSGNKFFNGNVKEDQKLKVKGIIFQSGIHINETWQKFEEERIAFEVFPEREKKHASLQKEKGNWYLEHADYQKKSYSWDLHK